MDEAKPISSFEGLMAQLDAEDLPYRRDEAEDALIVPTRLGEKEDCILHIRWEALPGVVQFIQVLPFKVPSNRLDEMAVLIGGINVSLPVLGFTLNPQTGVMAYRTHAFLGKEQAIAPGLVGALISSCVKTSKTFLPQLRAAAEGTSPVTLI